MSDRRRSILIVRMSALGDVVNSLPVAAALKAHDPTLRVAWLVEDRNRDVVKACPHVDEVIVYPRKGLARLGTIIDYVAKLRRRRFDVILDLQGNLKSGVHLMVLRGRLKIGFAKGFNREFAHLFANRKVAPRSARINRVEKYLSILAPLGIAGAPARFDIRIDGGVLAAVRRSLVKLDCREGEYIVIHPGTSGRGILKRWAPERYVELIRRIVADRRTKVLLTWGGEEERAMVEEIERALQGRAVVAPRTSSLSQLMAVLKGARLFIGSDSGPLHLANALGRPCVSLFGPKDPAVYAPYGNREGVVYKGVECSPCRLQVCGHRACMESISVDDVAKAVAALLDSKR